MNFYTSWGFNFRLLGACVLIVYLAVIYGTYVPDWQFTVNDTSSADFGKILTVGLGCPYLMPLPVVYAYFYRVKNTAIVILPI